MIPTLIELTLLALASWRTWILISQDSILDRPRRYVTDRSKLAEEWLECPYCSGFWVAVAWWGAWQLWHKPTLVAAGVAAVAALTPLIERVTSDE